jgi:hypothetical protein
MSAKRFCVVEKFGMRQYTHFNGPHGPLANLDQAVDEACRRAGHVSSHGQACSVIVTEAAGIGLAYRDRVRVRGIKGHVTVTRL